MSLLFNPTPAFSVVIPASNKLSYRRTKLLQWVVDRYMGMWDENELQIIIGTDGSEPFNRSAARNVGLEKVQTDYVLFADGDTAFDKPAIEAGLQMLSRGVPWVIPYGHNDYYNLTKTYTDLILDWPLDPLDNPQWDHRIHSWAGLLLARTNDCRNCGGYDERFQGWGWEDVAFMIVMDFKTGRHQRTSGRAMHLWHPRGDDEFGSETETWNRKLFDKEYRIPFDWVDERL